MRGTASISSIDALRDLHLALCKFVDEARTAMAEGESDIQRTQNWLLGDARTYWRTQIRKRGEALTQAKAALRAKRVFKTSMHTRAMEEEQRIALAKAQRRFDEAQTKLKAVQRWSQQLEKDIFQYRGAVSHGIGQFVDIDLRQQIIALRKMIASLDKYIAEQLATAEPGAPDGDINDTQYLPEASTEEDETRDGEQS